jgi:hypothetical protein
MSTNAVLPIPRLIAGALSSENILKEAAISFGTRKDIKPSIGQYLMAFVLLAGTGLLEFSCKRIYYVDAKRKKWRQIRC